MGADAVKGLDATALLVGQGVLPDGLFRRLASAGIEVQRAQTDYAAQLARVSTPELVVVAGDSASDRGQRVLALLASEPSTARLPVLVICGPSYMPVASGELAGRVAVLAPAGGLDACARHIHALLARIVGTGLGALTLQQAVDEIAPPSKAASQPRLAAASAATAAAAPPEPKRVRSPTLIGVPVSNVVIAAPKAARPQPVVAPEPNAEPRPQPAASAPMAPAEPTPEPAPAPEPRPSVEEEFDYDVADTVPPPPSPSTSEALAPAADVATLGRQRSGPTPLSWSVEPASAADSHAMPAPKRRLPLPRATLIAGAAALVAGAGLVLASLAGPRTGGEPAASTAAPTGSISAASSAAGVAEAATASAATAQPAKPPPKRSIAGKNKRGAARRSAAVRSAKASAERAERELDEDPDELEPPRHVRRDRQRQVALANERVAEGHRLLKRGKLGLAEAAYMKALKALPNYPRALAGVVRVHLQRKDGAEAVRWAQRLVSLQPRRSNNQLMLGDAWALRRDRARARAAWTRAASYGNATARKRLKTQAVRRPRS